MLVEYLSFAIRQDFLYRELRMGKELISAAILQFQEHFTLLFTSEGLCAIGPNFELMEAMQREFIIWAIHRVASDWWMMGHLFRVKLFTGFQLTLECLS